MREKKRASSGGALLVAQHLERAGEYERFAARTREVMSKNRPHEGECEPKSANLWLRDPWQDHGGRLSARHMRICSDLPSPAEAGFAKAGAVAHALGGRLASTGPRFRPRGQIELHLRSRQPAPGGDS